MPTHDAHHQTIGLEFINGTLFLLGKAESDSPRMKVEVQGAGARGIDATVFVDKRLLIKAMKFGLESIEITDEISSVRFSQGGRHMIVMPIRSGSPSPSNCPMSQPTPIESGATETNHRSTTPPTTIKRMPDQTQPPEYPPIESDPFDLALEQLNTMKDVFRSALRNVSNLTVAIKQIRADQKSTTRDLQNFRNTLRSLQKVPL